jgi:hypothetical protein
MKQYFILLILLSAFTACSPRLSVFTSDLKQSLGWDEKDLKKIQFYVSHDIVLRRSISDSKARIERGKIRVIDGSHFEEVVIRAETPGVVVFSPDGERLAVSFDTDGTYLMFGPREKTGEYVLLASRWEKTKGWVQYGGKTYETPASSARSYLMADTQFKDKTSARQRVVRGREIRANSN